MQTLGSNYTNLKMETAIVQQLLDFFQDFINLCQSDNWPDNSTSEVEIKNAFLVAQHVGKCLERLRKQNVIHEFLSTINDVRNTPHAFVKNCFTDPPKYILKKIINSQCKIHVMDTGFKIFLELFEETQLEIYLTDFMLEAASIETLLKVAAEIPRDKLIELKSLLLLTELNACENPTETLLELLKSGKEDNVEVLLVCLSNKDVTNVNSVENIANSFIQIMRKRDSVCKMFWKSLFHVKHELLIQICTEFSDIFNIICGALSDVGKLLKENMCTDYFYINLTYSELRTIVQSICNYDDLKMEFMNVVCQGSNELDFWENIMS